MTSTPSSEGSDDPLTEENLLNIQSVIHVTRENIDALNDKFANLQEPPPMYLSEYQELTSKLHELEAKEMELLEQINAQQDLEEKQQHQQQMLNEYSSHYQNRQQIQLQQQQLLSRPMVATTAYHHHQMGGDMVRELNRSEECKCHFLYTADRFLNLYTKLQ